MNGKKNYAEVKERQTGKISSWRIKLKVSLAQNEMYEPTPKCMYCTAYVYAYSIVYSRFKCNTPLQCLYSVETKTKYITQNQDIGKYYIDIGKPFKIN